MLVVLLLFMIFVLYIMLFVNEKFLLCGVVRNLSWFCMVFISMLLMCLVMRFVYVWLQFGYGMILIFVVVYFLCVQVFWIVFCLIVMCLLVSFVVFGSSFDLVCVISCVWLWYRWLVKLICWCCCLVVVIDDRIMLNLCVCSFGISLLKLFDIYMYFVFSFVYSVLLRLMLKFFMLLLVVVDLNGGQVGLMLMWMVVYFFVDVSDVIVIVVVERRIVRCVFMVWFCLCGEEWVCVLVWEFVVLKIV